ncbi:helix-turn-helix domain-containing protein [uncultured Bacteroides sp.]|uniref:helix-turn-helix domain-containing protein n=1 Tax=uncultured Bacteroides sp. TaxID=162156 RepID=UPI00259AB8A9|nr:helix-turn-helix domain-containing protein [uncultured Bacteroides sp.]
MSTTKKCQFCGKPFVPRSGMQRYCSEACQAEAKRARVMQKNNLFKVAQPLMKIQHQEYLTFSKAAILMGCSRQYIYKLVALGKLKASRISNRMAFIRRADIEQMLEGNPYHRILPGSTFVPRKSASSSLPTKREIREKESDEVLDFYSGEEVMTLFKVKQSWLYTSAKRNHIPICRIAGKNYYSKKHIDEFFGVAVDISGITDWLLTEEVEELFGMKPTALRAFTYRHKIPTKREYGRTYYSKSHLDELRRTDLVNDERYYTVEQVQQIYGLSSANICHIVKVKHIEKIKVGVKNLLLRSDVERVMAERNKQP